VDAAIGSRIKQLREARKLSQMDLANEVGVSLRTIGTWEKTGRVPMEQAVRLAEFFGVESLQTDAPNTPEPRAFKMEYDGWVLTLYPPAHATAEEVEAVAPATAKDVMARVNAARAAETTES
jgi:transcriptional regulator with XRE-family HTH domain